MMAEASSLCEQLAALPAGARDAFLSSLPLEVLAGARYEWPFWARADQLEPAGAWRTWLMRSGRGAGKTRAGAEWVRAKVEARHLWPPSSRGPHRCRRARHHGRRSQRPAGHQPAALAAALPSPPAAPGVAQRGRSPCSTQPKSQTACAAPSARPPGSMNWPPGPTPRPTTTSCSACAWGSIRAAW